MNSFDQWMKDRQAEWRRTHVASQEHGKWRSRPYAHILPKDLWEEGLWPGKAVSRKTRCQYTFRELASESTNMPTTSIARGCYAPTCTFPSGGSADGKALFASFLKRRVAVEIDSLEEIELEYEDRDSRLRPSHVLGEEGGTRGAHQTSPDLGLLVNGGQGLVLVENKLTEDSFYKCSAWKHKGSRRLPGNPDSHHCNNPLAVAKDYASQCHQHHPAWGRRYWEHLAPVVDEEALASLPHCPAMRDGFQLFRQHALAEGMAQSGRYNLVVSAVAVDERNDELDAALKRSGIAGLRQWEQLFKGRARFAVFTHQEWVGWVQERDTAGRWSDWLGYVSSRYGLGG